MAKILVLNAGSSSIKYCLFAMQRQTVLIAGLIERIGEDGSRHHYQIDDNPKRHLEKPIAHHQQALQELFACLTENALLSEHKELLCIGHRVVHGGEQFREPAVITSQVLTQIASTINLAPLHNPANLLGIEECLRQMPDIPQVAVFDTAFHHTIPEYAFRYAIPERFYKDYGVRRYGFHGASHYYVAKQAANLLGKDLANTHLITLHLGNGASVTAIENGRSVDTSMGMTPLEGLIMGSRCGDLDPAIAFYLQRAAGLDFSEIENIYNKESGCKGICGENDMRAIHALAESGNANAALTLEMYAYRLKKYIGAYYAVLGGVDALVFTGGIGENDYLLREQCCRNLSGLGIKLDLDKNRQVLGECADISCDDSSVRILVIATHEELEIALQAEKCIQN